MRENILIDLGPVGDFLDHSRLRENILLDLGPVRQINPRRGRCHQNPLKGVAPYYGRGLTHCAPGYAEYSG